MPPVCCIITPITELLSGSSKDVVKSVSGGKPDLEIFKIGELCDNNDTIIIFNFTFLYIRIMIINEPCVIYF